MPHRVGLIRLHPLGPKASFSSVRRRLKHQLPLRRKRSLQPVQRLRCITRPSRYLGAVQVHDRQSAPHIRVAGALHAKFAVKARKVKLPCICPRRPQRSAAQRQRQTLMEPVHGAKNSLRCLLRMGHLDTQRSRYRNRLQKKPARYPCAHAHLPGFKNNIPLPTAPFVLLLYPIRQQRHHRPATAADF